MLGGNLNAKQVFDSKPELTLPFPLRCFTIQPTRYVTYKYNSIHAYILTPHRKTLRTLRQLVLQYVYIRPISATIVCILHALGQ